MLAIVYGVYEDAQPIFALSEKKKVSRLPALVENPHLDYKRSTNLEPNLEQ